ncbi:MAG: LysR family transcriptional regulator, partial [Myxococcota bacterium]
MDLDRLRLFVQVADAGGFSDAARRLGAERSSVSRGVAKLERELGVQLFHRSTRSVALTSAGEALHAKVATHLAALERAIDALPEREEAPSGTLRITAPHDIGASDLSGVIADFVRRFPKVHVDVRVTNRRVDLVAEGFDAALRPGPARLPDSSLRATRLSEATGGWYASPRYVARAGSPRTLAEAAE